MRPIGDYYHRPETCSPQDWIDAWNQREIGVFELYSGLGGCVGRYPIADVLGLIEDKGHPCRGREEVQEDFRSVTQHSVKEGLPVIVLNDGKGAVTRAQLLEMEAYYKRIDMETPVKP